jgi:general secretion pathway protein D
MKKLILLIGGISAGLFANQCSNKFFDYHNSMNKADRLYVKDFLNVLFTKKCGINIIYEDNIAKKIISHTKMPFINISHYSISQILDLLFSQKNLFYSLEGDKLRISYYKTKTYNLDFLTASRTGVSNLDATDSKVTNNYKFNFWNKVQSNIETILKNTAESPNDYKPPVIDKDAGLVTVTGTKKQLEEINDYIKTLVNRLTKQVFIDVKIYSVELSQSHKTGIDWSQLSVSIPESSVPFNKFGSEIFGRSSIFNSSTFNLKGFLNFLAQNGNVNAISNPKIVTLNNQKAIISIGDTIYYKYASSVVSDQAGNPNTQYTIDSKFVGVTLDITPQINSKNEIILSIEPKISAFKDQNQLRDTKRDMPPDTRDESLISIVKLKNNNTLVLGGIITTDSSLKVNGVPVLKEIPLIKYLFSSKEKITNRKEIVFVITPHIIDFNSKKKLAYYGFKKIKKIK